jgi:hypothetical protein
MRVPHDGSRDAVVAHASIVALCYGVLGFFSLSSLI